MLHSPVFYKQPVYKKFSTSTVGFTIIEKLLKLQKKLAFGKKKLISLLLWGL